MKTLTFRPDDDRYRTLHEATLTSQLPMTPQVFRAVARVQERLEALGEPLQKDTPLPRGVLAFFHCPAGGDLTLEDADFAVLRQLVETTPWPASKARYVVALHDLLESAS